MPPRHSRPVSTPSPRAHGLTVHPLPSLALASAALGALRRVRAGGSAGLLCGSAHPGERRVGALVPAGDGGAKVDGYAGGADCVGRPAAGGGGCARPCGADESGRPTDVADSAGAIGGGAPAGRGGARAAAKRRGSEGRTRGVHADSQGGAGGTGERGGGSWLCWRWAVIRLGRVSAWHAWRGSVRAALSALTLLVSRRCRYSHEPWSVHYSRKVVVIHHTTRVRGERAPRDICAISPG
jgi:hypothetical protein